MKFLILFMILLYGSLKVTEQIIVLPGKNLKS